MGLVKSHLVSSAPSQLGTHAEIFTAEEEIKNLPSSQRKKKKWEEEIDEDDYEGFIDLESD